MAKTRKIILFLVEGITDKQALGLVLSKIVESEEVGFEITQGDISTKEGITPKNAKIKVNEYVKNFLDTRRYKRSDLAGIIHLIDTDGAFIGENHVIQSRDGKTHYYDDRIEAKSQEAMKERNRRKKEIIHVLSRTASIANTKYQMYYLSRNMEHVFHDIDRELTKEQKMDLAEQFEERYADCPEKFIDFICTSVFAVKAGYIESWDYIMEDLNSLERKSNFNIFLRVEIEPLAK